jgi:hypothetical protein
MLSNSCGGITILGTGVATRANAPTQINARTADACDDRKLLTANPAKAHRASATAAHPQRAGERWKCPASQIPQANAAAARARGARDGAFVCKRVSDICGKNHIYPRSFIKSKNQVEVEKDL